MQVNVYEAKSRLSELLAKAEAGEEVVIARSGRPIARLVPVQRDRPPRVPGSLKGKLRVDRDFDEPDRETDLMERGRIFPAASDRP